MSRLVKLKEILEDDKNSRYPDYRLEPIYVDLDKIVEIRPFYDQNGIKREEYCRIYYAAFIGTSLHIDMDHMSKLVNKTAPVYEWSLTEIKTNADKEEAVAILSDIRSGYNCFDIDEEPKYRALSIAIEALKEHRTGKWAHGRELWREQIGDAIISIGYENWRCGECGALVKDEASKVLWKYCPWCGAKMEGAENGTQTD